MKTRVPLKIKHNVIILYYDMPLISLIITEKNEPVLEVFCDVENGDYKYAYIFLSKEDAHNLIFSKKSYYDIIKNSKEIYTFREKYLNNGLTDFSKIEVKEFLESYGPKEDVFLIEEDSDLYDFSEILRDLSVE